MKLHRQKFCIPLCYCSIGTVCEEDEQSSTSSFFKDLSLPHMNNYGTRSIRNTKIRYSFNLPYFCLPFISFCTILLWLSLMHKACLYFLLVAKRCSNEISIIFTLQTLYRHLVQSLLTKLFKYFNDILKMINSITQI